MINDEITEDDELDPRLDGVSAQDLFTVYFHTFEGYNGLALIQEWTQDPESDRPIIETVEAALDSAFIDMQVLAAMIDCNEKVKRSTLTAPDNELEERLWDMRTIGARILIEFYWRIHDGWEELADDVKHSAAKELRFLKIKTETNTPDWQDLLKLLSEINGLDYDGGDGDVLLEDLHEDLLTRFEQVGSVVEPFFRGEEDLD